MTPRVARGSWLRTMGADDGAGAAVPGAGQAREDDGGGDTGELVDVE